MSGRKGDPTPARIRIDVEGGTGVEIDWADGHKSRYAFQFLRDECPCALCRGHGGLDGPRPPAPKLALYKEPARCTGASAVGNYAFSLAFSDGHASGIYSYDFMRGVCPCADCRSVIDHARK